ncbi:MAG: MBL fold metallo-hydrolase [Bacteroidales bacterium]
MIEIKTFYFNDLRVCTYLLWDSTKESVIVDPGCHSAAEEQRLLRFIEEKGLKPQLLVNTHGHFDHILGNGFIYKKWGLKAHIHKEDKPHLERAQSHAELFGYIIEKPPLETIELKEGDTLSFGNSYLKVIETPGHSRGGVSLYNPNQKFVITGDSLFAGSIGRTDLPGGDYEVLMDSLFTKLLKLGKEYTVYPGHGPSTTIAHELLTNPFLKYE